MHDWIDMHPAENTPLSLSNSAQPNWFTFSEDSSLYVQYRAVADVNALGYRLLPTDRTQAIAVFQLNTIAFPNSANVWDSYGEALAANGDKEGAINAYRKALSLDPHLNSSAQALAKLGVRG
jgi:Flp pilus assembly protein TadD